MIYLSNFFLRSSSRHLHRTRIFTNVRKSVTFTASDARAQFYSSHSFDPNAANINTGVNTTANNAHDRRRFVVSETNSITKRATTFVSATSSHSSEDPSTTAASASATRPSLLSRIYLPEDYPNSVGANFLPYCSWLLVQNAVGSAAYVLSTNAMLVSVGVTSAAASLPLAATVNWVLKDGLGSLGMIAFAAYVGQRFDANAKSTKWFADVLFNIGVLLELMTPLVPTLFLPLASLANVAKGIGGLAAGASKASLHKTLALRENLGDITAKLYSQGITAYLIGVGLGIQLTFALSHTASLPSFVNIWTVYVALTAVHLFASHRALCLLQLSTLNHQRLSMLVRDFVERWPTDNAVPLLTPAEVSRRENIIRNRVQSLDVRVAPSLLELSVASRAALIDDVDAQRSLIDRRYAVLYDERAILYHADASTLHVALSYCEFEILRRRQRSGESTPAILDSKADILNRFCQLLLDSKWDVNTQLIKQTNKITLQ